MDWPVFSSSIRLQRAISLILLVPKTGLEFFGSTALAITADVHRHIGGKRQIGGIGDFCELVGFSGFLESAKDACADCHQHFIAQISTS